MAQNFNQSPYFDDFDELKEYYNILFRPGVAVQTRELNQLQSILQNQVTKVGDHLFKEGSMVIPGQVSYNDKLYYVKLAATNLGIVDTDQDALSAALEGQHISDVADGSGVKAMVIKAIVSSGSDPITLIVLYTQSNQGAGNVDGNQVFQANNTLYLTDTPALTLTVKGGSNITGKAVAAALQQGVYYLAGHFVTVPSQTLVVKKYADTTADINARIGIQYVEEIITSDDDSSLYDNAAGSANYAAPGAHRYKINASFVQVGLDETPDKFFELIRVQTGTLQNLVNASQYNILEDTLARRTFEESGNYVVNDFKFELREARSNNRGTWNSTTQYEVRDYVKNVGGDKYFECLQSGASGSIEPTLFAKGSTTDESTGTIVDGSAIWRYTSAPRSNSGLDQDASTSNLVGTFGIGTAFVQGYEVNKIANSNITIPKARDVTSINNFNTGINQGNFLYLNKSYTYGVPDISTGPRINLFDRAQGTTGGKWTGLGNLVGSARINWVEPDARGGIKVGMSDIVMNPGKNFATDVTSLHVPSSTTSNVVSISYTASGAVKFNGASTPSYVQVGGIVSYSSNGNTLMTVTSNTNTANFIGELVVGDTITFGTSSHSTTCSWTVVSIASSSNMVISGPPLTSANAGGTTSAFVRIPAFTIFGHQTGIATRFQSELRIGDPIWIGAANNVNTATVISISSEARMTVSSAVNYVSIAGTSIGLYYVNRQTEFGGDLWGTGTAYLLGVNANKLTGTFSLSDYTGGTTVVPASNALKLTGSNDAKLTTELIANDFVTVNNNRIFITKISSNTIAYGVCLDGSVTPSGTSAGTVFPAFKIQADLNQSQYNTLLFPVIKGVSDLKDNSYTVYKIQTISGVSGVSNVTVTLTAATGDSGAESLATSDPSAFYVAASTIDTLSVPSIVNSVAVAGTNVTLNVGNNFSSNVVKVIYPVVRVANDASKLARVRTKTLVYNASDTFLGSSSVAGSFQLRLSNNDIYRVVKVYLATSGGPAYNPTYVAAWDAATQSNAIDITTSFELDNGQRDIAYETGILRRRPGLPNPAGSIKVFYDYFAHGDGDFFAYSSYSPAQVPPETIPKYRGVYLGDVLDFRTQANSSTGLLTGAAPPRFGSYFSADVSFYLGRKDKIFLDHTASFYRVPGVSAINPQTPVIGEENANNVNLYNIELTPYTFTSEYPNVKTQKVDNRRYTMKDIGSIDKRVGNLEEATALTLLELKSSSLQIRDNLDSSIERYKTGLFVDNFTDASNAEIIGDARFSIDPRAQTLNPFIAYHRIALVEKINSTSGDTAILDTDAIKAARSNENYAVNGNWLTLSFTTSTVLKQPTATTSISVAPFLKATWWGNLKLVPDADIYQHFSVQTKITGTGGLDRGQTGTTEIEFDTDQDLKALKQLQSWLPMTINGTETVARKSSEDITVLPSTVAETYCRANTILMMATGMRPNTKLYSFFDDIDIRPYISGAIKLKFQALPILDVLGNKAVRKDEWPRWRSVRDDYDLLQIARARKPALRWANTDWVYNYNDYYKSHNPKEWDDYLPSTKHLDAYRKALANGENVWYYQNGRCVGSAVAVYQDNTTLFLVNARGKLSPKWLRAQANQQYDYALKSGTFYVTVAGKDYRTLASDGGNGTTGTVVTAAYACTDDVNGNLYSDSNGVVCALFDLPHTHDLKFINGFKPIVITDSITNDPDEWGSRATATYTAVGINIMVDRKRVIQRRRIDPIAQSFMVPTQYSNGVFVTDVDFFFQSKPTANYPVQLEVRKCDSTGRPGQEQILLGSQVTMYPGDINVDATLGQTPTKFKFEAPLYLEPDTLYALVLKADTTMYRVWIASLGQNDVSNKTSSYSTQATMGSLFKSQDGTLWTEDQLSDIKFTLNRAVFTQNIGRAHVVNHYTEATQLPANPFTFQHGSNKVRIAQKNHGLSNGDLVKLFSIYYSGQYASLGASAKIYNIPVNELFGTSATSYDAFDTTTYVPDLTEPSLVVSDAQLDTYCISTTSTAHISDVATTGITTITAGGDDVRAQSNVLYHIVTPNVQTLNFQPTALSLQADLDQGFTYDGVDQVVPYTYNTVNLDLNVSQFLSTSSIILSDINETFRSTGQSINAGQVLTRTWNDSFIGRFTMSTTDDAVSPAIDLSTLYIDTIQHRIDNPTAANRLPITFPSFSSNGSIISSWLTSNSLYMFTIISSGNATVAFDGTSRTINTTEPGLFSNVVPGRYISISGSTISANTFTSTALLVTAVSPDGKSITVSSSTITTSPASASAPIWIWQWDDYTEEATRIGSNGESKYVTKPVNLANPASQLKIILESSVPNAADFDIYYKTAGVGADLTQVSWVQHKVPNQPYNSSYTAIVKTDTRGSFSDIEITVSGFDNNGTAIDLPAFSVFQVKIVMRSSNGARVPQFRSLRVIAHA